MAQNTFALIPLQDPLVEQSGTMTFTWVQWFNALIAQVGNAASAVGGASIPTGTGSISPTDLSSGGQTAGLYRVEWYARITQAATVSSSLTVTIGWTDGGISLTESGAAITGNTTSTYQHGSVVLYSDAASPIGYATTYASVGATSMTYKLYVVLTQISQ